MTKAFVVVWKEGVFYYKRNCEVFATRTEAQKYLQIVSRLPNSGVVEVTLTGDKK